MKATIESYKPTIERYYNPKDIEQYKKLIAKRCEKQVFAKVPGSHFEYKDCKGQTVVHNIDIDTKTMHGTITGESNKESGNGITFSMMKVGIHKRKEKRIGFYHFVPDSICVEQTIFLHCILQ